MKSALVFLTSIFSIAYAKAGQLVFAKISTEKFHQIDNQTFDELTDLENKGKLYSAYSPNFVFMKFEKTNAEGDLISKLRQKGVVHIQDSVMGSDTEGGCKH